MSVRRKVFVAFVAACTLTAVVAEGAFAANPGTGTTTTNQALNIQIDSPADGATVAPGTVNVSGRASIGPLPTSGNAYYMIDVSTSTDDTFGFDCDGNSIPNQSTDDLNGDGSVGDTLDCEIGGVIALNASLGALPSVDVGLGAFSNVSPANGDVDPSAIDALFTNPPDADRNANGAADIAEVARSVFRSRIEAFSSRSAGSGGTSFDDAIDAINDAFATKIGESNTAFLLTDGLFPDLSEGPGSPLATAVAANTKIHTYSVGGGAAGCGGSSELTTIASLTGGECTDVANPADLIAEIGGGGPPAGLQSVTVSVNGGTAVTAPLDLLGNWNANVTVGSGPSTIAAKLTATDAATASADITVNGNGTHKPTANDQCISTTPGVPVSVTLTASDPDNDPLTYTVVSGPAHGTLSGTAPNLTYTPAAGFEGPDSFTFKATDKDGDSNIATICICVLPTNHAPVADQQCIVTPQNTAVPIVLTGSDPDGDRLTYVVVANPSHGTLTGSAPNLTYTPANGYKGSDLFKFKVSDATLSSAPAIVCITVTGAAYAATCRHKGKNAHGSCKWFHVPKDHKHLKVRNYGKGWVAVTVWVNGNRLYFGKMKHGPLRGYNLARYLKGNGRDVVSIKAVGSTTASAITFGM